jgi:hypothetical protein
MLFHYQNFEERLRFFKLNVCDFPEELSRSHIRHKEPELVIEGLKELEELFKEIFSAVDVFDKGDPLESLHNVSNTIMLLYSAGYVGELCRDGNRWFLDLDKKELKNHYKLSMNKPIENLSHFGFYYECYKNGKETESLNKCSMFHMFCDNYDNVPLALSYIMKNALLNVTAKDYARMQGIFYKLDYRSMLLNESTKREDISPLREDILNTACSKKEYFKSLVETILNRYPLYVKPKFHEYYTPHWILQFFTKKSNKFVFNVNVPADTICLEIRLSIETVENLAKMREMINGQLKKELESFGCISCNNDCEQENIREKNGVKYCVGYSEARLLMLYITSEEDVKSAIMLMDMEQEVLNWQ